MPMCREQNASGRKIKSVITSTILRARIYRDNAFVELLIVRVKVTEILSVLEILHLKNITYFDVVVDGQFRAHPTHPFLLLRKVTARVPNAS